MVMTVEDRLKAYWGDRDPDYMPTTQEAQLGYLIEEMGEALAAAGKTLRWGVDSSNPEEEGGEENGAWLARELDDVETGMRIVRDFVLDMPGPYPSPELPHTAGADGPSLYGSLVTAGDALRDLRLALEHFFKRRKIERPPWSDQALSQLNPTELMTYARYILRLRGEL